MTGMPEFSRIAPEVKLGPGVQIYGFVNLYGCVIGEGTRVETFVEIQRNAVIDKRCKISSHTFICEGVMIEDECFIGHGVMFINDKVPAAVNSEDVAPNTVVAGNPARLLRSKIRQQES